MLGIALHRQGNLEAAIEAFAKAAGDLRRTLVLNNLGAALLNAGVLRRR